MKEKISNNLFFALSKYPTGKICPEENYFTEAFAWILRNNPDLTISIFKNVFNIDLDKKTLKIKTQVYYEHKDLIVGNNSYIDLQIEDFKNLIFLEDKISACLNHYCKSDEQNEKMEEEYSKEIINQYEKYKQIQQGLDYAKELHKAVFVVGLTEPKDNVPFVFWKDIYSEIYKRNEVENNEIVSSFLDFMEIKSMSNFKCLNKEFFSSLLNSESSIYDDRTIKNTFEEYISSIKNELNNDETKSWTTKMYRGSNGELSAHFTYPNSSNFNINVDANVSGLSIHLYFPLFDTGSNEYDDEQNRVKNHEIFKLFKENNEEFNNKIKEVIHSLKTTISLDLCAKQYKAKTDAEKAHGQNNVTTEIFSLKCGSDNILRRNDPTWLLNTDCVIYDRPDCLTKFFKPDEALFDYLLTDLYKRTNDAKNSVVGLNRFFFKFKKYIPNAYAIDQKENFALISAEIIKDLSQVIEIMQ